MERRIIYTLFIELEYFRIGGRFRSVVFCLDWIYINFSANMAFALLTIAIGKCEIWNSWTNSGFLLLFCCSRFCSKSIFKQSFIREITKTHIFYILRNLNALNLFRNVKNSRWEGQNVKATPALVTLNSATWYFFVYGFYEPISL